MLKKTKKNTHKILLSIKSFSSSITTSLYFIMLITSIALLIVSIVKWKSYINTTILIRISFSLLFLFSSILLFFFTKLKLVLFPDKCSINLMKNILEAVVWVFLLLGIIFGLEVYLEYSSFLALQKEIYTYIVMGSLVRIIIMILKDFNN